MKVLNLTVNDSIFNDFETFNPDEPYLIFGLKRSSKSQNVIKHLLIFNYVSFNNKKQSKNQIEPFSYIWVELINYEKQKHYIEFYYKIIKKGEINVQNNCN